MLWSAWLCQQTNLKKIEVASELVIVKATSSPSLRFVLRRHPNLFGAEVKDLRRNSFSGSMAKNKQKGKKQKNVFQVANKHLKNKNKAKPVTTALKHINKAKNEKVENLNKIFTEVQRDVKSVSKSVAPEPKKQMQAVREPPKESVNVDNAAQLFSQL